jgi:hypothetical protein
MMLSLVGLESGHANGIPAGTSNVLAVAAGKLSAGLVERAGAAPPFRAENPGYSEGVFGVSVQTWSGSLTGWCTGRSE